MTTRTIVTEYYVGRTVVKRTRSIDPLRAIQNATAYLVAGKFGDDKRMAGTAQIVSDDGVRVYSELVVGKDGNLRTTLGYNPGEFVTPGTLHYFKQRGSA